MPVSLKLVRAGQQILNKIKPDIPVPISSAANYFLNPVRDPQKAYMWEVNILSPTGGGETLKYYAKNIAIPQRSSEVIVKHYMGEEYSYSGRENSNKNLTISFWDNQSLDSYRFFQEWLNLVVSGDMGSQKASALNQFKHIGITLFDVSDLLETQKIWFMQCYPVEVSDVQLNYADSSEFSFDVTLRFERRDYGDVF